MLMLIRLFVRVLLQNHCIHSYVNHHFAMICIIILMSQKTNFNAFTVFAMFIVN